MNPIILFSGGVDSLALLMTAIKFKLNPLLLHIVYDHPAKHKELLAVSRIHEEFAGLCKLRLQSCEIFASDMAIGPGEKGAREVRGRNLMFISAAINATTLGDYNQIWIGLATSL